MTIIIKKQSYTIPCSSAFRDVVIKLAENRLVNVADLARSILLILPEAVIRNFPDPGEPKVGDREKIILKSGSSKGRPWMRKPRLQVRLNPGYEISFVRRALNLAVILDENSYSVKLEKIQAGSNNNSAKFRSEEANGLNQSSNIKTSSEIEQMLEIVSALSFTPLPEGLSNRTDALHVMGFFPSEKPDKAIVHSKFRLLAQIHHPDSKYGNHNRMSQLNAAMDLLDV